jgi:hypothetical protein
MANNDRQQGLPPIGKQLDARSIASVWCAGGFAIPFAMYILILVFGRNNPPAAAEKEFALLGEIAIDALFVMQIVLTITVLWICRKRLGDLFLVIGFSLPQSLIAVVLWILSRFAIWGIWF